MSFLLHDAYFPFVLPVPEEPEEPSEEPGVSDASTQTEECLALQLGLVILDCADRSVVLNFLSHKSVKFGNTITDTRNTITDHKPPNSK